MEDAYHVTFYHQVLDNLPTHLNWLHPKELLFFQSLKFEKRRNDWLLGRWTAKKGVIAFFEKRGVVLLPHSFAILKQKSGAPELVFEQGDLSCHLSLSHRAGHAIAVVVPKNIAIGCDLELIEPRSDAFLSDYFLEGELAFLSQISPEEKDLYANLIWSVKESVMKATGEGMKLHPRKIEVGDLDREFSGGWHPVSALILTSQNHFEGFWKREGGMVLVVMSDQKVGQDG